MINVIFDMDGTLLDSEDSICEAVNEVRANKNLPALPKETIKHAIHTPSLNCAKIFYEIDHFTHKSYKVGFEKYFTKHYEQSAVLFANVVQMLEYLKQNGYFLALASNAPHDALKPILQRHKIAHFFDEIIGTNENIESKPSPMMIEFILQKAPFSKSIFVGNCLKDEGAAQNAGIAYLSAKWGQKCSKENEFSSAKELLEKIQKYAHQA